MKQLGNSDVQVSNLALGTNVFGWTISERAAHDILDQFVAEGFNLIDTANVYPYWVPGLTGEESETIIGNWLGKRSGVRSRVVLATKVGFDSGRNNGGLSKSNIIKQIDKSLHRLNTSYIDIYQSHIDDTSTPIEETLGAYDMLIEAGKIRVIGASNFTSDRLKKSITTSTTKSLPTYSTFQPEYNLIHRSSFEKNSYKICIDNSISILPYFSLASGYLTGKYRTESEFLSNRRGSFVKNVWDTKRMFGRKGLKLLSTLDYVSNELQSTPTGISLSWLLSQGVTAPIASATSKDQLSQIINGVRTKLPTWAKEMLDSASANI
ncbi:aldo/keto reductase [Vibrio mediterranei]|uniref:aldo/keto reductase n=1 Tax=Vibrio mediterranei TaxID=689 RepID=UPI001EFE19DA|nr:aldo/keto reductase [Vibrio mediterranei]MCG9629109.1 aldo/keto reductase [Vibrio mediterranei]